MPIRARPETRAPASSRSVKTSPTMRKSSELVNRRSSERLSWVRTGLVDDRADVAARWCRSRIPAGTVDKRSEQREEQRRRVAEDVQQFLAGQGAEPPQPTQGRHGPPPSGSCSRVRASGDEYVLQVGLGGVGSSDLGKSAAIPGIAGSGKRGIDSTGCGDDRPRSWLPGSRTDPAPGQQSGRIWSPMISSRASRAE